MIGGGAAGGVPFRFRDPREERIYRGLLDTLGPGPAAFFRDACWIKANPRVLMTSAHLVAHCLREIEELFRAVLCPPEARGEKKRKQVERILERLEIGEEDREKIAVLWKPLYNGLSGLAHKSGTHGVRTLDELDRYWEPALQLFDHLLSYERDQFLRWLPDVDAILDASRTRSPSEGLPKRLTSQIPNTPVIRRYFFGKLENPAWLRPLWERGFFKQPPEPQETEEGLVRFPPWPEGEYLARVAGENPELVGEIIRGMEDTENPLVIGHLVDALVKIPVDVAVGLMDKVERWAEVPYLLVPEKLAGLACHLAKGGQTQEALSLMRILLAVLPDPRSGEAGTRHGVPWEPRGRFDIWQYEELLRKQYPDLVREAGLPALDLLSDLLEEAIRLTGVGGEGGEEDYSYVWRPAVESHEQNLDSSVKDALVSAVRDAGATIVEGGLATVEEVVGRLSRRPGRVFRRIALYLLGRYGHLSASLLAEKLGDRGLFDDAGLRHEYGVALRARFRELPRQQRERILGWIEEGPDEEWWKDWWEREEGRQPAPDDVRQYRETWQRDWLARIGPENLPGDWQERYETLVARWGEPDHPDFPVYTKASWIGPTSPLSADDIRGMSVQDVVDYLGQWRSPDSRFQGPSPEGLGRVLASVVTEEPGRFAMEAVRFRGQDPTYVRAVISGLKEAAREGKRFAWQPVLELCKWVVSQPREIGGRRVPEGDADPDWGWTRREIASLLSVGLESEGESIPLELRKEVWAVLEPLTDDPEPTPEYEARFGGANMDPVTLSINTVRGEAIHAVVRYGLWLRSHRDGTEGVPGQPGGGFAEMPEVRAVLEAHLDRERDPSLAVRAVYGKWFPWLLDLDPDWARASAERIFPLGEEDAPYFDAAWIAYVWGWHASGAVFAVLQPQYEHALQRVGLDRGEIRLPVDPDEKLAEHLMELYWQGRIAIGGGLLEGFWKRASESLRAHALEFIGRALTQTDGEVPEAIVERLKRLWEMRLGAAKEARDASEVGKEVTAFGWWFVSERLDAEWSVMQLRESLRVSHATSPAHMVLERLAVVAEAYPRESVECLRLIAEGDREGWTIDAGRQHARKILAAGMSHPGAREEARRVINYLGSRGFLQFRDLLGG